MQAERRVSRKAAKSRRVEMQESGTRLTAAQRTQRGSNFFNGGRYRH
jgi:hypothetical protein